jgi:hypothetical protein
MGDSTSPVFFVLPAKDVFASACGRTMDQIRDWPFPAAMFVRQICLAVCALLMASCASRQVIEVDGKTPIFEFELKQMPRVMEVMVATVERYEKEFESLELKPGERQTGTFDFGMGFKGASGVGPNGKLADGYVIMEKLRVRTRNKDSEKARRVLELCERVRADMLRGFSAIAEPVLVDKFVFD